MHISNRTTTIKITLVKITLADFPLLLLPAAAQAVEVSMSGQVNRLMMNVDNGNENGVVSADN